MTPRDALAASEALGGLPEATLDALSAAAVLHRLRPAQALGGRTGVGWVVQGLVHLEHRPRPGASPWVSTLGPGRVFGPFAEAPSLRGVRASSVAVVDGSSLTRVERDHPALTQRLSERRRIHDHLPQVLAALGRSPVLGRADPGTLMALLGAARLHRAEPVSFLAQRGALPDHLGILLSGEAMLRTEAGTVRVLGPGEVWGDLDLVTGRPLLCDVVSGPRPVEALLLPFRTVLTHLASSPRLRRAVLAGSYGGPEQRRDLVTRARAQAPASLRVCTVSGLAPPARSRLLRWLASSCARAWADRTVLVRLDPAASAPVVRRDSMGRGTLITVDLPGDRPPQAWPGLAERLADAHTIWLDPGAAPLPEVWRPAVVRSLTFDHPGGPEDPGEPLPVFHLGARGPVPPGALRVPADLAEAEGSPDTPRLPDLQASVDRLARAATDRLIGLALGGGGALALAHVPLIQALDRAGVPIDLISGTSGGSLVAAFYAARGLAGLDHLVAAFPELGRVAARCLHSSAPLEQAVDELLRGARLGDQLVRFLPVVVDIDAARLEVLREGSLGLGVRASGALPGPFAPVLVRQTGPEGQVARRLVDGGVMDLVPVDTLYAEGAAVGIASQVLSPPLPRPPEGLTGRQGLRGGAERALKALDPARRLDDALRAAFLMMGRPVAARAAARFTVPSLGFNPLDWSRPQAILDALATSSEVQAQLGTVVREAEEAMRALQWRKGRAVQGGWSVVAEVSRDEE